MRSAHTVRPYELFSILHPVKISPSVDSKIFAGFLEFFAQSGVIDFGLINEPRSPSIFIGAAQWICAHEIDVIRDDHQMAAREAGIDSARCVRQNESVAAESADHTRA